MDIVVLGAIKTSGTTFSEKVSGVQHLVVFHQSICQMCKKTNTIKTLLSGRGTYHCPKCQK
jgi:formamidopyrimidine-DNA glycosylase